MKQNQMQPLEDNMFLMLPQEMQTPEDPDFIDNNCLVPSFNPYQGKVVYEINEEDSDLDESDEVNEDILFAKE